MLQFQERNIPLIEIFDKILHQKNSHLYILREDLIHPEISGNKWRKLKYNIQEAKRLNQSTLLTVGGAYSNHIAATAAAGRESRLKTIGIIRGEEILPLNPTLELASKNGMTFKYISREEYRKKNDSEFLQSLKDEFGDFYLVPEGGSNALAVKGCTEILKKINVDYDVVCVACGTGGTIAGIISSTNKKVIGFPALKNASFLKEDIQKLLANYSNHFNVKVENNNWDLNLNYHFGGYAKIDNDLIDFVRQFKATHDVPLDLIYIGKMLYGIFDLLKNTNELDNQTIMAIHTGGLQGNKGFEERLKVTL